MTDRDALLRAICDDPDDDAPRLIYADWLDENGDPMQAEFIRLQMKHSPILWLEESDCPTVARQRELWKEVRRWRYARHDWASRTVDEFTRGFCPSWSGTVADFLRIAPHWWRIGPTISLTMSFEKKGDVKLADAREVAKCDWLQRIQGIRLTGRWLTDEWVAELLKSPFATVWREFSIDGPCLTDGICETLTTSVLVGSKAKVDVYQSRLTDVGHSAIILTFPRPDEFDD